jgi:hypothetical protein
MEYYMDDSKQGNFVMFFTMSVTEKQVDFSFFSVCKQTINVPEHLLS